MPLAPLPASNTGRAYVDYNDGHFDHTLTVRYAVGVAYLDALDAAAAVLSIMEDSLNLISIEGARYSVVGSDITFPATWPGATTYGTGTLPEVNAPRAYTMGGKSVLGRLTSITLYGINEGTPVDYVLDASDWGTQWPAARTLLNNYSSTGIFVAIDGEQVLWRDRVTVNFNDHYVVRARG